MLNPNFPNSAIIRAAERLVLKHGRWKKIDLTVRYGLFDHPHFGTCLIDTGYTNRVTSGRRSPLLTAYSAILKPVLTHEALPNTRVSPNVILLTHLHADHVSALRDYPEARIYAHAGALNHYLTCGTINRIRHGVFKELLPDDIQDRVIAIENLPKINGPLGLSDCFDIFGDGSILALPLPGHMRGHIGFVFPSNNQTILYAGDAAYLHRATIEKRMPGPPISWILDDTDEAEESIRRIAEFTRKGGKVVYCHDPETPL